MGAQSNGQDRVDTAGVRVPPPLIYLAGYLVGVAVERVVPTPNPPRLIRRLAATVGMGLAGALAGTAARGFIREDTALEPWRPATSLVTTGPYRFTRNPMYLGMATMYAGAGLARGHLWSLALLPAVVAVIDRAVIAREEPYLERTFGDVYTRYRGKVRRWF